MLFMPRAPQAAIFAAIIDKHVAALLISLSHCYQKHAGTDENSTVIKSAQWYLNFDANFDFNLGSVFEINAFSHSNAEHLPCINKSTGSFVCLFIYSHCRMENTLSATHTSTDIKLGNKPSPRGKG